MSGGRSIFWVDPGETSGWAWVCVGQKELETLKAHEILVKAGQVRSGTNLMDRRFMFGQFPALYNEYSWWEAEHLQAFDLYIQMQVQGHMATRTSGGVVEGISDLGIEDFTLRERTSDRSLLSPVRIAANLVSVTCMKMDPRPTIHWQSASDKSVMTDERLKRWGLYQRGKPHANDAIRHLLLFIRKLQSHSGGIV